MPRVAGRRAKIIEFRWHPDPQGLDTSSRFEIVHENDVPVPPIRRWRRGCLQYELAQMKVLGSFHIPNARARQAVCHAIRRYKKIAPEKEFETAREENGVGFRCFRMK